MNVKKVGEIWLQGRAVASGFAIGMPFFLKPTVSSRVREKDPTHFDVYTELQHFREAVSLNQSELQELSQKLMASGFTQEADVVEGSFFLASDPLFLDLIEAKIRGEEKSALHAIGEVKQDLKQWFCDLEDPYISQRFEDINGVCDRLSALLASDNPGKVPSKISTDAILCAHSVTAPLAAQVSVNGIGAIVTACGGSMSHTAIIAKSKGIPYVADVDVASVKGISPHEPIIVDGLAGIVILRPNDDTLRRYMDLKVAYGKTSCEVLAPSHVEGATKDGHHVSLLANVAKENDIYQISQYALDGVGLYRTEYQILEKGSIPSEEEQFEIYSGMVRASHGRPLVIRVFDFGSDKGWEEVFEKIPDAIQGKRSLALLLACPELFRTQLRAIMRASRIGPLSLLLPMVSSAEELNHCLDVIQDVFREVSKEGAVQFPRIGAMLEMPSVLFHVHALARKVDFFSLGTNDLIQYAFAVDRSNSASFDYRVSFHPGLMHLIHHVVKASLLEKVPLCVCGEMASEPLLVPFLIGLGVRELSMAPRLAPHVRKVLASFTLKEMEEITKKVLEAQSAQEVYIILRSYYAMVGYGN